MPTRLTRACRGNSASHSRAMPRSFPVSTKIFFAAASWLALSTAISAQTPALYSIDGTSGPPTDEETFYLELINRARANPTAEGQRLRDTTDADVLSAVTFFKTDMALVAQE